MNVLEKIKLRQEARKARRNLSADQRAYADRITAGIWSDSGDIGEAMRVTEIKVGNDAQSMGFDPATILMIVQLALLIYKALKALNVMSPTLDDMTVIFESGDE